VEITRDILKSLIKEELTKATLGELDLPDRGFDAKQWDYARTQLDAKIKSVLQDKESQALNIDDKKIMRVMRGLNNVIGQNPHIAKKLSESLDAETAQKLEAEILAAYQQMTTPTDVDQTYADTGEPVSKDPRVMHDEAVEFLHLVVDDVISGNTLENPRTLNEDGHSDVPSAVRAMKTIIEDAGQMLQVLEQTGEGSLPTWWTNKMAVSASMMNKMRDYLLYPKAMDEGFMDAVKRKIGTMPDDRSTVEKIKSHPEMKGRDKLGPARGPIMSVIEKYASEEEMETILSALEQPAGAAIGLPMKENKD
jgi:hypothetical protein